MPVSDVLLFSARPLASGGRARSLFPVASAAVEVAPGISLASVRPEIATAVMNATRFRSQFPQDTRVMYGLVRYNPPGHDWDEDDAISKVLFLSHFVHAHEGGFEFSARITTNDDGQLTHLTVADIAPPFARAYCSTGATRRWFTQNEVLVLRDLVAAYDAVKPSLADTRLGLAISTYGESAFVFHGRPRGLLLATTLEGLVSTMPDRAVKQFTTRVPALAIEVGLASLDRDWADNAYRIRSKLAHGASIGSAKEPTEDKRYDEFNRTLTELDELLRRILRTALLDATFRDRLTNVDVHWPVMGKGCPACRSRKPELLTVECPICKAAWNPPPLSSQNETTATPSALT
jgi:hypothetical protein